MFHIKVKTDNFKRNICNLARNALPSMLLIYCMLPILGKGVNLFSVGWGIFFILVIGICILLHLNNKTTWIFYLIVILSTVITYLSLWKDVSIWAYTTMLLIIPFMKPLLKKRNIKIPTILFDLFVIWANPLGFIFLIILLINFERDIRDLFDLNSNTFLLFILGIIVAYTLVYLMWISYVLTRWITFIPSRFKTGKLLACVISIVIILLIPDVIISYLIYDLYETYVEYQPGVDELNSISFSFKERLFFSLNSHFLISLSDTDKDVLAMLQYTDLGHYLLIAHMTLLKVIDIGIIATIAGILSGLIRQQVLKQKN